MKHTIRLLLADDHELIRQGMQALLTEQPDIQLVATASNGCELVELAKKLDPDVILSDIKMPGLNGVDATREILRHNPRAKVLALSFLDNEYSVIEIMEAGAMGYIVKNAPGEEIIAAVRSAHRGIPYYCGHTAEKLSNLVTESGFHPYTRTRKQIAFDEREIQVIRMICQEKTSQEIGEAMHISTRTAEWYRHNIIKKAGVKNTAGLVIYAVKKGLYEI